MRCLLLYLSSLLVPAHALATDAPGLSWVRQAGAENCITAARLVREVEAQFGPVFAAPSEAHSSIEGWVRATPEGGFEATVQLNEDGRLQGTRRLRVEGPDCAELTRPLLVVVALLLDPANSWAAQFPGIFADLPPNPAATLRDQPAAPSDPPPPDMAPAEVAPADVAPAAARSPRLRAAISLGGGLGVGMSPGLDGFVQLAWVESRPAWGLRAFAVAWPATSHTDRQRRSLRMGTGLLGVEACPAPFGAARVQLRVCLGISAGTSRLQGGGFLRDVEDWQALGGPSGSAQLSVRLNARWRAFLAAGALIVALRVRAQYEAFGDTETFYEQPLVVLWGGPGVSVHF